MRPSKAAPDELFFECTCDVTKPLSDQPPQFQV